MRISVDWEPRLYSGERYYMTHIPTHDYFQVVDNQSGILVATFHNRDDAVNMVTRLNNR